MSAVADKKITTIEGLVLDRRSSLAKGLGNMQRPAVRILSIGQIMQAAAMLKSKPKPTDLDIDESMQGNICRCGTYQRIRKAIKLAAGVKS